MFHHLAHSDNALNFIFSESPIASDVEAVVLQHCADSEICAQGELPPLFRRILSAHSHSKLRYNISYGRLGGIMFRRMDSYQASLLSASAARRLAYVFVIIAVLFLCVVWAVSIP